MSPTLIALLLAARIFPTPVPAPETDVTQGILTIAAAALSCPNVHLTEARVLDMISVYAQQKNIRDMRRAEVVLTKRAMKHAEALVSSGWMPQTCDMVEEALGVGQ